MSSNSFRKTLEEAVRYFTAFGFESPQILQTWLMRLRFAAEKESGSLSEKQEKLKESLSAVFRKMIQKGRLLERSNPHVTRVTLEMVAPSLRNELDRRILASADLIRLNRSRAIEETLQRFSGWSTSIPPGGSRTVERRDVVSHIAKPLHSRTFEERRLAIDQGHKLVSNVNHILGMQSGAIAVRWRHVHQANYDGRPEHEERDNKIFLLRESWAREKGFVKPDENGFYDDIDAVAELPFCRCWAVFLVSLSQLPGDMLTKKGREAMEEARIA